MNNILFREITPYYDFFDRWNDVTINAGAAQSTLQDIKLPESAGCFTYHNSSDLSSVCSNRFIYWRTNHDVIELVEISLNVNLRGNHLRLRFQNTPILRGISIHENLDQVVLLIATVSAIHKLVFPHPKLLDRDTRNKKDGIALSIFYDTTEEILRNRSRYFVLNNVSLENPLPHTSCSWLDGQGKANFILANNAGSVLMLVMSDEHGIQVSKELMKTGMISRIFSGLVNTVIKSNKTEVALNIICHHLSSDILVYLLFNDLQIRIWSYKKQEYILADSIINYDSQNLLNPGKFTSHLCQFKKSEDIDNCLYLAVFVPVLHQKLFYIFKQDLTHQDPFKLNIVCTLQQTQNDLVDFCIESNHLWTLWLSPENNPLVLSAVTNPILNADLQRTWIPIDLEPRVSRNIDYDGCRPQDIYIKEIFKVGRFLPSTINKALSIYSSLKTCFTSTSLKLDDLKNHVIEAVENKILLRCGNLDEFDQEYINISAECWDHFFSYCIQYHEVGMKPLGIAVDPNTGYAIVIKKNFYSLLSPCDPLQYIISADFKNTSIFINLLDDDKRLYTGLRSILECIHLIRQKIDNKLLLRFEDRLHNLYSPIKYVSEICKSLDLETDNSFLDFIHSILPSHADIVFVLNHLLIELDLGRENKHIGDVISNYLTFANSSSGTGILSSGLTHFAKERFEFCRDLLFFEVILWGLDTMESDQLDNLMTDSAIVPKTVVLVRSYYIVYWCTQTNCVPATATIQDAAFKQFCVLEFPEYLANADLTLYKQDQTISGLFLQQDGGSIARKVIHLKHVDLIMQNKWVFLFPSLVVASAALLWPLEGQKFPEFLFSKCQFSPLQEYDRLLQDWCSWNKQYLNFLVATSHLILGNEHKALNLFLVVSKEIKIESLLFEKLLRPKYNSNSSIIGQFCMKVIQMLEQFSLSNCIVRLVNTVINEIDLSDPNIPIFYSVLFKHYLNLGNYEEAFETLRNNPDPSRRKDCLRQLIVYLCENKLFEKIINLSYLDFNEEIINILESRARCSDLSRNTSFYGILYALHVNHKKFRKAAAVMYEMGMRFGKEIVNLKGLSKQVSCYLTTINCLHLAEPDYAWIVKPVISFEENIDNIEEMDYRNSPKRNIDGEEIISSVRPVKVEVMGLNDIRKEYNVAQARLQYAQKYKSSSNLVLTPLSAEETVALLLNASLFDSAIHLSKSFSLSLVPVFEALTYKCLSSVIGLKNYVNEKDLSMKSDMHEELAGSCIAQQNLWNMLKTYLFRYEVPHKSDLHKCITEKLLSYGAALPAWLKLSYQKCNFTELLFLYVRHGLLEDASNLMIKYIKAVLGVQKEDFELNYSLHCNSPPVWLPHTYIDILLDALYDLRGDENYNNLYSKLQSTVEQYNKTVESVTESKLGNSSV